MITLTAANQGAANPHFLWLVPLAVIFWVVVIAVVVKVVLKMFRNSDIGARVVELRVAALDAQAPRQNPAPVYDDVSGPITQPIPVVREYADPAYAQPAPVNIDSTPTNAFGIS